MFWAILVVMFLWQYFGTIFSADFMDNILDTFRSYFNSASFGSEYLQSCLPKKFRKALVS